MIVALVTATARYWLTRAALGTRRLVRIVGSFDRSSLLLWLLHLLMLILFELYDGIDDL